MSQQPAVFPYVVRQPGLGPAGMAPMLPIVLSANGNQLQTYGLVDSGAAINLLPMRQASSWRSPGAGRRRSCL